MAVNIQLKDFTSKTTLVPADLIYAANSADSFNEVKSTVAGLFGAYPALLSIGGLTTVANQYILTTGANTYSAVTVTATPTISVLAAWDANKSLSATSFIPGFTTQATAAGTTVLTVASNSVQEFTGATTQTVTMPVVSTLAAGQSYTIINNSSGVVTVNSSGGNVIQAMAAGTTMQLRCVLITGTTAASWSKSYQIGTFPLSILNGGTGVTSVTSAPTASAWAGWDANSNFSANSLIPGFQTTVTAAGTTVLTVGSKELQEFTGATTQTVTLPVASTLVPGQQFTIINNSSGNVTVNSSGGNAIQVMAANTTLYLDLVLASGTTAASWNSGYVFDNGAGVLSITGTANQVIASASTGAITLSLPQSIGTTSAVQFNSVRFNTATAMLDANGLSLVGVTSTASAVNYLGFANAATAGNPVLSALGSDTNVQLQLTGKGTSGVIEQGITSGSNAPAGYKGEIISAAVLNASAVAFTTSTPRNITSISLTAGNWLVIGVVSITGSGAVQTQGISWCSLTSATLPDNSIRAGLAPGAASSQLNCPTAPLIVNTSSTVTCYLSGYATFASGTSSGAGYIVAIRI